MFRFTNLSVHHHNGDEVVDFGFCQVVTGTDKVAMLNPTTLGVHEKDDATTSVVPDNRMKTGIKFVDIVRGNQSPKSVAGINPVIPA